MFGFLRRRKPTFFRDNTEISLRAWWFASFVVLDTVKIRREHEDLVGITALRESGLLNSSAEHQSFTELIAYIACCALASLRDDIEAAHGWTDKTYDLNLSYQVSLGMVFDKLFEIPSNSGNGFVALLQDYYSPEYGDAYVEFWNMGEDAGDLNGPSPTISNTLSGEKDEQYNIARYYAFRVGRLYKKSEPLTIIRNALPHRDNALRRYPLAFKHLPRAQIEADLRSLHGSHSGG